MAEEPSPKLPVTAIVVARNEARLLERCLPTLAFCDELIVVDLESRDETAEVARRYGARVVTHAPVPIAEAARVDVAPQATHEWLLFLDPDEMLPAALGRSLVLHLPSLDADVGVVYAPWQFYFGERRLRGTVWGGENRKRLLVRRSGVELTPTIWGGTRLRPGYQPFELAFSRETAVQHHWVRGYRDWVQKHRRYLAVEPGDRAAQGEQTGVRAVLETPFRSFHQSFFARRGYLDGLTGLGLSVLWAVFRTASEIALLRELGRRRERGQRPG